jgi:hypothetical protein
MYKRVLDPPTDEWPVFPTFHYPTLGQLVREDFATQGYEETAMATIRDKHERALLVCREYALGPLPSITPYAARSRMQRLCEEAAISQISLRRRSQRYANRVMGGRVSSTQPRSRSLAGKRAVESLPFTLTIGIVIRKTFEMITVISSVFTVLPEGATTVGSACTTQITQ